MLSSNAFTVITVVSKMMNISLSDNWYSVFNLVTIFSQKLVEIMELCEGPLLGTKIILLSQVEKNDLSLLFKSTIRAWEWLCRH
jgi:hypothetical protein